MKTPVRIFLFAAFCSCNQPEQADPASAAVHRDSIGATALNLNEPKNEQTPVVTVPADKAFSIILTGNNEVFYYKGNDCSMVRKIDMKELRTLVKDEKARVKDAMFIIKAGEGSAYKASVDVLDEMTIAQIPAGHYMEDRLTEEEKECIAGLKTPEQK